MVNAWGQSWLALSFIVASPAGAQVTIDASKITCEQYMRYTVANPHDIAVWLSGYYNGKRNNTVINTREFREQALKLLAYCDANQKSTVMEAVEKVMSIKP
jgi:acid stress chaperone HdeB